MACREPTPLGRSFLKRFVKRRDGRGRRIGDDRCMNEVVSDLRRTSPKPLGSNRLAQGFRRIDAEFLINAPPVPLNGTLADPESLANTLRVHVL